MKTITRRDYVRELSNETGLSQEEVREVVEAFLRMTTRELARDHRIALRNFGVFEVVEEKARVGRNPSDPQRQYQVPARARVRFRAGKELEEKVSRVLPLVQQRGKMGS